MAAKFQLWLERIFYIVGISQANASRCISDCKLHEPWAKSHLAFCQALVCTVKNDLWRCGTTRTPFRLTISHDIRRRCLNRIALALTRYLSDRTGYEINIAQYTSSWMAFAFKFSAWYMNWRGIERLKRIVSWCHCEMTFTLERIPRKDMSLCVLSTGEKPF